MNIKFILTKDKIETALVRLTNVLDFDSTKKKLSTIIKTVQLFEFSDAELKLYILFLMKKHKVEKSCYTYKHFDYYLKKQAKQTLTFENFLFVKSEVGLDDLQYLDECFLTYQELVYFLYRITGLLIQNEGCCFLSRKYLLSFNDKYRKYTGRTLNRNKVAQLNKILQKYDYVVLGDNNRRFYMGQNHPLFDTNLISTENRKIALSVAVPVSTTSQKVQVLQQDNHNLKTAYRQLDRQYQKLTIKGDDDSVIQEYDAVDLKNAFVSVYSKYLQHYK